MTIEIILRLIVVAMVAICSVILMINEVQILNLIKEIPVMNNLKTKAYFMVSFCLNAYTVCVLGFYVYALHIHNKNAENLFIVAIILVFINAIVTYMARFATRRILKTK